MKYSLKSLMIVVTLFCVVLGGRIEYLRRMAAYHEREAEKLAREVKSQPPSGEGFFKVLERMDHNDLAAAYRKAVYRPWTMVDEDEILGDESLPNSSAPAPNPPKP